MFSSTLDTATKNTNKKQNSKTDQTSPFWGFTKHPKIMPRVVFNEESKTGHRFETRHQQRRWCGCCKPCSQPWHLQQSWLSSASKHTCIIFSSHAGESVALELGHFDVNNDLFGAKDGPQMLCSMAFLPTTAYLSSNDYLPWNGEP